MNKIDRESIVENPLSDTERQALHLVGEGLSNRQIADQLFYSEGYIKSLLNRSCRKLVEVDILPTDLENLKRGISRGTTAFAARAAAEHGLIHPLPIAAKERIDLLEVYQTRPAFKEKD